MAIQAGILVNAQREYRPDIDGLRALSVASVVLYHLGLPSFSGGFVGVDVFFVISGYLITGILLKELRAGQFSILRFYERHIRRIFPALFSVLAFVILGGLYLLPRDLADLGKSACAAALSVSNVLFYSQAGYFDRAAELKPLLHTWSLAVEEQFYLLWPLVLWLIAKLLHARYAAATLVLLVLSLGASIHLVAHDPSAGFYLPFGRAWELLIGAVLALDLIPTIPNERIRHGAGLAGVLLIIVAVLGFDSKTSFPGLNALFPCVGAALVLHSGAQGRSAVARALSVRPVVFIGLISYSLYLWHWPLLSFFRYYTRRDPAGFEHVWLIAAMLLLSIASWYYVERPFRDKRLIASPQHVFAFGAGSVAAACAIGIVLYGTQGLPGRLPEDVVSIVSESRDPSSARRRCFTRSPADVEKGLLCAIGSPTPPNPTFVVWGDSHADAFIPGIDTAGRELGVRGINASHVSCPPLLGVTLDTQPVNDCAAFNDAVLRVIRRESIGTVILVARWAAISEGTRYGSLDVSHSGTLKDLVSGVTSTFANHEVFALGLDRTVSALTSVGCKVFVVRPIPETEYDVPSVLALQRLMGSKNVEIRPRTADYLARTAFVLDVLNDLESRYPIRSVDPAGLLCGAEYCQVAMNNQSLYFDSNHLSPAGARYLSNLLRPALRDAALPPSRAAKQAASTH